MSKCSEIKARLLATHFAIFADPEHLQSQLSDAHFWSAFFMITTQLSTILLEIRLFASSKVPLVLTVEKHTVGCHLARLRSVTPVSPLGPRRTKLL
jgi:hypothetical protein